jgi:hypothetical protein
MPEIVPSQEDAPELQILDCALQLLKRNGIKVRRKFYNEIRIK